MLTAKECYLNAVLQLHANCFEAVRTYLEMASFRLSIESSEDPQWDEILRRGEFAHLSSQTHLYIFSTAGNHIPKTLCNVHIAYFNTSEIIQSNGYNWSMVTCPECVAVITEYRNTPKHFQSHRYQTGPSWYAAKCGEHFFIAELLSDDVSEVECLVCLEKLGLTDKKPEDAKPEVVPDLEDEIPEEYKEEILNMSMNEYSTFREKLKKRK